MPTAARMGQRVIMSHTVLRGQPVASQLYLDTVLDEVINEQSIRNKKGRDKLNLAEIIYYCMKKRIDDIFMINGFNGDKITNGQILKYAVPLAKAIRSRNEKERIIMIMMKNTQQMASLYYAALFAGVVPLMIDSNSTIHEIRHFVDLVSPYIVFCDRDRLDDFKSAVGKINNLDITFVEGNDIQRLESFCKGHDDDMKIFQVSDASPDKTALLLPTSGSSGLAKATVLNHQGLIAQLPALWIHHRCFPRPTKIALLLSSAQWMTHTILMTTCPVYGVSLLMTPEKPTTQHVLDVIHTFQPTWALFGPNFAQSLAEQALPQQLDSLETIITTGAPLTLSVAKILKKYLPASCYFGSGVGMTETHGFFTMPGPKTAWDSNDKIMNTWYFKLMSEDGKVLVEPNQKGELLLKSSSCPFMGYYNNSQESFKAVTPDGWILTGDLLYVDEIEEVHYVERKKIWFKYFNYHISPVELENVISLVAGVQECVVCESEKGPTAAVVLWPGFSTEVRDEIHKAINTTLSDHKRLRGGIAFVSSLPYTHSGKIKRAECATLIQSILSEGDTFL